MKDLGLTKRTLGALDRAGIKSVEELRAMPHDVLAKIPGIGRNSLAEIGTTLRSESDAKTDGLAARIRQVKLSLRYYRGKATALEEELVALKAERRAGKTLHRAKREKIAK